MDGGGKMKTILSILLFASCALAQTNSGQLTVKAPDGSSCTVSTSVTLTPAPVIVQAPTVSLGASPANITSGQSSTLTWSSANANGVDIEPGVGAVALSGSVNVSPSAGTTYTATASNSAGSASASATVTVTAPAGPPVVNLCPEMTHNPIWPSGYSMWNNDVGGHYPAVQYLRFVPTHSGTVSVIKWYNSADSKALRDACSSAYGSVQPCDSACGDPQYRYKAAPGYSKACPKGWQPFADACAANPSGCYSAGTGGKVIVNLLDANLSVLATATLDQPTVAGGFRASYPNVVFDKGAPLTAGSTYYLEIRNADANPGQNWFSWNSWTPYNLFDAATAAAKLLQIATLGGKAGVANAIFMTAPTGAIETNYQPIFSVGYEDGTCITQGFAP